MTGAHVRTLVLVLAFSSAECLAAPLLTLTLDGPAQASSPDHVVMKVNATNADFGLGGLSYTLETSVPLTLSGRSYSAFGWEANDGLFDNCLPAEGALPIEATSFRFDTVFSPAGGERAVGASGMVEQIEFALPAGLPEGSVIALAFSAVSASDGMGVDLVVDMGGTASTTGWQILIPEPSSLLMLLAGVVLGWQRRRG